MDLIVTLDSRQEAALQAVAEKNSLPYTRAT
ncbi:hypothetical protein Mesau_05590 [Mesorhizobium australicum WSM2073]|uniref:Uncharacterized protein n=3 Tax=Mesorhizobium TaxID=68287 RepID=L0KT87_MESAW|nr:hypothetical protein Mesci_5542 [Mesorhizobium ciceri biovar biserrulae WSM1271]AEH90524.1 hypothetical protein Mesop_6123 [Mesorhizobium opportunistum WSM2075]AGB47895.1 hypothetical protein Mesau_05590 [Mesorhizobium australicum WSM2073]